MTPHSGSNKPTCRCGCSRRTDGARLAVLDRACGCARENTAQSHSQAAKCRQITARVPQGTAARYPAAMAVSPDDQDQQKPHQFRSQQPTLAMGGDVNHRERMPSLREMAEEFVERTSSVPMPPSAAPNAQDTLPQVPRAKASRPPPQAAGSVQPQPAAPGVAPDIALSQREGSAVTPAVAQPVAHVGNAVHGERSTLVPGFPKPQPPPLPGGAFPGPAPGSAGSSTPETIAPHLIDNRELRYDNNGDRVDAGDGAKRLSVAHLRARWASLDGNRKLWAAAGALVFVAGSLGFWLGPSFRDSAEPGSPLASAESKPAPAENRAQPSPGALPEGPTGNKADAPAAPATTRDPEFAVRTPKSLPSCEDALERPFRLQPEPHAGKGGAYWSRSRKALLNGNARLALSHMCTAAEWDIAGRATYGLSEYYDREGDFQQALTWAQKVPKNSKRYGDAQGIIGDIHSQLGHTDQALQVYLERWNLQPSDTSKRNDLASRFVNSASSALRKQDYWTAERFYRRALSLNPQSALGAAGLARVLAHFELNDAAVHWAERALNSDESSAQGALVLCEAHVLQGNKVQARAALDKLRTLAPSHPRLEVLARHIASLD